MTAKTPLGSRPLDLLYFVFFLMHLPASLLFGCQPILPPGFVPSFMSELLQQYTQLSGDPLIIGAMSGGDHFVWLKMNFFIETFYHVPVFFLGMRGLWNDARAIYVLLLGYGTCAAATTLSSLAVVLSAPITSPDTVAAGVQSITESQRILLLSSYVPFALIPSLMAVDMSIRLGKLVRAGEMATKGKKSQ